MEIRRVNKHFYCNMCNRTFSELVDPDKMEQVVCPNCGKSFVEIINRPIRVPRNLSKAPEPPKPIPGAAFWRQRLAPESLPPVNHRFEQQPEPPRLHFARRQFVNNEEAKEPEPRSNLDCDRMIGIGYMLFELFSLGRMFRRQHPRFVPVVEININDFRDNFASNFDLENIFRLGQLLSMQNQQPSRPPASKNAVGKLPIFKLEKKHCKIDSSGKLEYPGCAICCSNISLGDSCQLLPCGHMYHPNCIKPWFQENNTCPTCRYELPTDDPQYEQSRPRPNPIRRSETHEPRPPSRHIPTTPARNPAPASRQQDRQNPNNSLPRINPTHATAAPTRNPQNNGSRIQQRVNPSHNQYPRGSPVVILHNQANINAARTQPRINPIVVNRERMQPSSKSKPIPTITTKMIRKPRPNN